MLEWETIFNIFVSVVTSEQAEPCDTVYCVIRFGEIRNPSLLEERTEIVKA